MTELQVIRNNKQKDDLSLLIREKRLPFKIVIQDISPQRSLDLNEYYWGVVVKMIADYTGDTILDTHVDLSNMFRFQYYLDNGETCVGVKSTTLDNNREFMEYIDKCCAWAIGFLNLYIPLPNEMIC